MAFGYKIMDLFRQLGIEEQFLSYAKPTFTLEVFNLNKNLLMKVDNYHQEEKYTILPDFGSNQHITGVVEESRS
jgi:hypothetical protein